MNMPRLKELARDLRKQPPRSPHEKLGGFVIAARSLDKCRAFLAGINGEYNFHLVSGAAEQRPECEADQQFRKSSFVRNSRIL
jgi:hypothetical protein